MEVCDMILRKSAYGYRVRWLEQGRLRQQTMKTPTAAKLLHAKKVLTTRGGRRRPVEQPRISVAAFADQWLDRKQHDLAPKTYASYAETVKRYIVKAIGTLPVREVTQDDITALLTQASATSTKGQLSKDTLRIIRGTCSRLFKAAIRARLIESNPCADLA